MRNISELRWWALKERNSCCPEIDMNVSMYLYYSNIYLLPISLSISLSLSVCLSVCLSIYLSIYPKDFKQREKVISSTSFCFQVNADLVQTSNKILKHMEICSVTLWYLFDTTIRDFLIFFIVKSSLPDIPFSSKILKINRK